MNTNLRMLPFFVLALSMAACEETPAGGQRVAANPGVRSVLGTRCPEPSAVAPVTEADLADGRAALSKINHFVVIYMENHSFDNLYGLFPGADGLLDASCQLTSPPQVDERGAVYERLPGDPPFDNLPNRPFDIGALRPPTELTADPPHSFSNQQAQVHRGAMNQFVAFSGGAKSISLGYYDTLSLPVPQIALDFTVCDRFFHSAFGGSFLNHMWLISARTPVFPNAPPEIVQMQPEPSEPFAVDSEGNYVGWEDTSHFVTKDGYAVNTAHTINSPHPLGFELQRLLPSQTDPTVGDRLSAANVTWAWYSGSWNETLDYFNSNGASTRSDKAGSFAYHHQPFVYFENFKEGAAGRAHLKDELDFRNAVRDGSLPAVSFVKPTGVDDEHPGISSVMQGQRYAADLIRAVMAGPNWNDTAIIVTYDENGGYADHVAPPVIDRWGPAVRVPTIVISPYARKHFVDHTVYETVSILATLERRFGLQPLSARDAAANDMAASFTTKN
jgi:acid phosphatase